MDDFDPHTHVDRKLGGDVVARDLLAAAFGLVADPPVTVTTGCELEVSLARTSRRPESVTCLPCREYAQQRHRDLAAELERMGCAPGVPFTEAHVAEAAARHRELARRFG